MDNLWHSTVANLLMLRPTTPLWNWNSWPLSKLSKSIALSSLVKLSRFIQITKILASQTSTLITSTAGDWLLRNMDQKLSTFLECTILNSWFLKLSSHFYWLYQWALLACINKIFTMDYDDSFPLGLATISTHQQVLDAHLQWIKQSNSDYETCIIGSTLIIYIHNKIVVSQSLQRQIVDWYHMMLAQPDKTWTIKTIKQHFHWQTLSHDIQ